MKNPRAQRCSQVKTNEQAIANHHSGQEFICAVELCREPHVPQLKSMWSRRNSELPRNRRTDQLYTAGRRAGLDHDTMQRRRCFDFLQLPVRGKTQGVRQGAARKGSGAGWGSVWPSDSSYASGSILVPGNKGTQCHESPCMGVIFEEIESCAHSVCSATAAPVFALPG